MPLTVEEKAEIAHHLGHPNLSEPATWRLGIPMLTEQNSLLLRALDPTNVVEERLPLLRRILCALRKIEAKRDDFVEDIEVDKVGDVDFLDPGQVFSGLDDAQDYWVQKLVEYLGVPPNPFAKSVSRGGLNLRVAG